MQSVFATIEQTYQNPGNRVLRLVAGMSCNVADEVIKAQVEENAKAVPTGWLKQSEAHDGVALLCASGPSLADCIDTIRDMRAKGATLFAFNGAAAFLWEKHGIMPDYQVLLDARLATADLIGPARNHLFASQVHPSCFKARPFAQLWHCTFGDWIPDFPDYSDDYCIIGGSVTVGNTGLALAYAMGYRDLHCFGYDSSHRSAKGHAFSQPLNDTDAVTVTRFGGRDYVSSYAMKLQAQTFLERTRQLDAAGCKVSVYGDGLLPAQWQAMQAPLSEREKYELMWQQDIYRVSSPGEMAVERFLGLEQERGDILDIGCGTGRSSIKLAAAGFSPLLVDFAENARDEGARGFPFQRLDLTVNPLPKAKFGFCTDVMEHLPTEDVSVALDNILSACERVFFTISTVPDAMGALIGKELHLTVKPYEWWRDHLREAGAEIEYGETGEEVVVFYVRSTRGANHDKEPS